MAPSQPRCLHDLHADPLDLLQRWPENRPVALLRSAREEGAGPWSRWSLIAEPAGRLRIDQRVSWSGPGAPPCSIPDSTDDPLELLEQIIENTLAHSDDSTPSMEFPVQGGCWLAIFAYELGRLIEPTAIGSCTRDETGNWPLIDLLWCPTALVHDGNDDSWWSVGGAQVPAAGPPSERVADLLPPTSIPAREEYLQQVQGVIDFIHAGDVFQVNLTRRLRTQASICPRTLAASALQQADPRYGFYAELPGDDGEADLAVLSLSPELFLKVDNETRHVITRPIKGTRPSDTPQEELADSTKDAAELHMIVDLMRNDLGRVCETGSVEVIEGRCIESHPTVHHGVGEIHGRLRVGTGLGKLLNATFPPGSITGAPKIRAMQIIHDLEPCPRGPYCGAMGWLAGNGACLSVGIRTLALRGRFERGFTEFEGTIDFGTGGGIVADSDPEAEFQETRHKAAVFQQLVTATPSFW